jgi:signal transduction histidine kinase
VQHAGASSVDVTVSSRNGELLLAIADDGRGFPPGGAIEGLERAGHLGLAGMRERITAIEGAVELGRGPRGGARVLIHVPVAS